MLRSRRGRRDGKHRKLLVASVAVAALAVGLTAGPEGYWRLVGWWWEEPFYDGRPATYWRDEIAASELILVPQVRNLGSMRDKPDVAPGIICLRSTPFDAARDWFNAVVGRPPGEPVLLNYRLADAAVPVLQALLGDADPKVRGFAAQQLSSLGKVATPALPKLAQLAQDDGVVGEGCTVGAVAQAAVRRIERDVPP